MPRTAALLWVTGFVLSLNLGLLFPSMELERLAATLCALGGTGLLAVCGTPLARRDLCAPALCGVLVAFWVLVVVSAAWSVAPAITLIYAGIFSVLPATVLAVVFASGDDRRVFLHDVTLGLGVVLAALCLWAVAQVFWFPAYLGGGQVRHPFANPNAFAGLLTLATLVTLGAYLKTDDRIRRTLCLLLLALCGMGLAAISGQAAILTLVGGLILTGILVGRPGFAGRVLPLAAVLTVVLAVGALMAIQPGKTNILGRLEYTATGDVTSWDNRVDIWIAALKLVGQHPMLGTGYKTFFLTYPSVRPPTDIYSGGFMTHADPLQFWAELGVGGVVLFYAAGLLALLRFTAWYKDGGRDTWTIALFAGCVAFIVHTHVDFLLYTMPTMLAFALALGTLTVRTGRPVDRVVVPLSFTADLSRPAQVGLLLMPVGMLLYLFIPLMVSEHFSSRAAAVLRENDLDGFAQMVNLADRIGMGLNPRPYSFAVTVPMGLLKANGATLSDDEQRTLFRQVDGLLRAGLRKNSRNAALYYHRADLVRHVRPAIVPADYPSAEDSLRTALGIDPQHLPSRLALADLLQGAGQKDDAFGVLADGLGWPYTHFDPLDYYSRVIDTAGEMGHQDVIARAEKFRDLYNARIADTLRRRADVASLRADHLFLP